MDGDVGDRTLRWPGTRILQHVTYGTSPRTDSACVWTQQQLEHDDGRQRGTEADREVFRQKVTTRQGGKHADRRGGRQASS